MSRQLRLCGGGTNHHTTVYWRVINPAGARLVRAAIGSSKDSVPSSCVFTFFDTGRGASRPVA